MSPGLGSTPRNLEAAESLGQPGLVLETHVQVAEATWRDTLRV